MQQYQLMFNLVEADSMLIHEDSNNNHRYNERIPLFAAILAAFVFVLTCHIDQKKSRVFGKKRKN